VPLWFNKAVEMKLDVSFLSQPPSLPVVAGVSGGADSLCLLGLLLEAGYPVIVAHLDHQLRPEAQADAEHVCAVAKKSGVPFITESMDVTGYAREQGLSIEEAARKCRYQFLYRTARLHKARAVAVAHTADDQVETILMHLVRGTGLAGLNGMSPLTRLTVFDSEIPLVRPILHLWRGDTESYCLAHGLDYVIDSSNADQSYFRNHLRHGLIPEIETYNPLFKKAVARMSRSLQDDFESLNQLISQVWEKNIAGQGEGYFAFHLSPLQAESLGMRRHLFKRAMLALRPGLRDVDFTVLDQAAQSSFDVRGNQAISPSRRLDLTGGLYLYQENDLLYIACYEADLPAGDWPQVNGQQVIQIGDSELGNGWQLIAEKVSGDDIHEKAVSNDDPFIAWMDTENVAGILSVRSPRPGDSFKPLGMEGQTIKLSDFFVNIKVPKRARAKWPLLLVDDEIAWVMGLRLAHPYRLEQTTRYALHLRLKRLP
jgi:tRNA(Ile)-lysidine synthase